ncbi:MAG TPA: hypothetical protein VLD37_03270 [Candidatus Bilamarchaeum sp.]|nr:hypothetical protein [Candidatus Bilamarchaeum sp.]
MAPKKKPKEAKEAPEKARAPATGETIMSAQEPVAGAAPPPKAVPPAPVPVEARVRKSGSGMLKNLALAGLIIVAIVLAYYFLSNSDTSFVPGSAVDAETFKAEFEKAPRVFIVMDIRGVSDPVISNNILQCGVDFAGSSGMGPKNATYISVDGSGCVAPDGKHETRECFSWLRSGLTIYIKQGDSGAKYYSNGLVVNLGKEYTLGTCGIHRI